jgi:pyruvate formate lyase activating enzyme
VARVAGGGGGRGHRSAAASAAAIGQRCSLWRYIDFVSTAITGRVFDVQRYSLHNGPGIRTTVFLKGCPARCLWCHNPESQAFGPEVVWIEGRCAACGSCETVCPHGAPPPGSQLCTACGACVEACPACARQLAGRETTVAERMAEVLKDRVFYEESGGGVTFSGGEPLAQLPFLTALLEACCAEGLHTAVDTCGFAAQEALLRLVPRVDLFLFDVKLLDDARHREWTGLPVAPILDNLRALVAARAKVRARIPLVPGHTDAESDLRASAALLASLPGLEGVDLIPFHRTGAAKAHRLGRQYPLESLEPPAPERLQLLAGLFRERGLAVTIGDGS